MNTRPSAPTPGPDSAAVTKPLPDPSGNDLLIRAFEELMRYRHLTKAAVDPAAMTSQGCLKYARSSVAGQLLLITFDNCSWSTTAADTGEEVQWFKTGRETFTQIPGDQIIGQTRDGGLIGRRTQGEKDLAFKGVYSRKSTIDILKPDSDQTKWVYSLTSDVTIGAEKEPTREFIRSSLTGQWLNRVSPKLAAGAKLTYSHRPANKQGKAVQPISYSFTSLGEVSFQGQGSCLRPVSGQFRWARLENATEGAVGTETEVESGQLSVASDGLHKGTSVLPWTTCLEFSAQ